MNLNRFTLIGRLTKDIELRTTPSGTKVATVDIATNHTFKDNNGNKVEKTDYHRLTAFGKTAEVLKQYVIKGQEMMFEGRITYSQYEKDGNKVYRTDLIVSDFGFGAKPQGSMQQTNQQSQPVAPSDDYGQTQDINVDDIPF